MHENHKLGANDVDIDNGPKHPYNKDIYSRFLIKRLSNPFYDELFPEKDYYDMKFTVSNMITVGTLHNCIF